MKQKKEDGPKGLVYDNFFDVNKFREVYEEVKDENGKSITILKLFKKKNEEFTNCKLFFNRMFKHYVALKDIQLRKTSVEDNLIYEKGIEI